MNKDFENLNHLELVEKFVEIQREMRRRGIIRSKNVIGDLGEYMVINHYKTTPGLPNLQAAPIGTRNVDALSLNGDRYSIKATSSNSTSVFYGLPEKGSEEIPSPKFEFVVIAKFDEDFKLQNIFEISWEQFLGLKRWHSRMRAWSLQVTNELKKQAKTIYPRKNDGELLK